MALGEVLTFFGTVADYAAGCSPEEGERIASLAAGMANLAGLPREESDALYFAARLRNAGALGNAAFVKGEPLSERDALACKRDVPAQGARICERIAALPRSTAEIVRWQAECWDGTGYPDQLRWSGIPKAAQLLHIAGNYVAQADPAEALSAITMESGRTFAPAQARVFVMWFHTYGGEIESMPPPYAALAAGETPIDDVVTLFSALVDTHNGTPGRAETIARGAEKIAKERGVNADVVRQVTLAARLFGITEMHGDPLARLAAQVPFVSGIAPLVHGGTEAAPEAAQILAEALEPVKARV